MATKIFSWVVILAITEASAFAKAIRFSHRQRDFGKLRIWIPHYLLGIMHNMLLGQLSLLAQSYLFVQCASVHNIMFPSQKNICKIVGTPLQYHRWVFGLPYIICMYIWTSWSLIGQVCSIYICFLKSMQLYIMWFPTSASLFRVATMLSAQFTCIFLSTTQSQILNHRFSFLW